MQELRRGRYSVSRLIVNLVCVTKYRNRIFDDSAVQWLQRHCTKVCETMDARLIVLEGESDHIHLLIEYPPKLSISVLVNAIKGTPSRLLHKERPDLAARYLRGVLWSPSYFAVSAGGAPTGRIKQYIEAQRCSTAP
jgi:putative transposase